jgi:hypothetical protein
MFLYLVPCGLTLHPSATCKTVGNPFDKEQASTPSKSSFPGLHLYAIVDQTSILIILSFPSTRNEKMKVFFYSSLAVLGLLASSVIAESSSCLAASSSNTVAIFSSAQLNSALEVADAVTCGSKCQSIDKCAAWLYTETGGRCDLYRRNALHTAPNPGFVYGACDGSSAGLNSTVSPSSSTAVASSKAASSTSSIQATTGSNVRD